MRSGLYHGVVTHRRLRPVAHGLRYRIFMLFLDMDDMPALARLRLFGVDRAGLISFWQRDHGDRQAGGLRGWVDQQMAAAGLPGGGRVGVLCMPRLFGHAFNPLTVFFCYAPDGRLQALIHAVRNTFGQRHAYVLPVADDGAARVAQQCRKMFHVSPFMDMDLRYRFRVMAPGDSVSVVIHVDDAAGPLLTAGFAGARTALTDRAVARAAFAMPLLGLKVLGGIHWQAVKLWWKGVALRPEPALPAASVSLSP